MKYIIFIFAMAVLAVDAQNGMDQFGMGRYGGSVEFKMPDHGAHVKAKKFGSETYNGNLNMQNHPSPVFHSIPDEGDDSKGDDFFKNFARPAGMPNMGGHKGLRSFFDHLGDAYAGPTSMGSGKGSGAVANGEGIVFGEGYGGSVGRAGGAGGGFGRGIVGSGNVIGQGEGFGMGFGQNGAEGYGRGPDISSAMKESQKWFGKKK